MGISTKIFSYEYIFDTSLTEVNNAYTETKNKLLSQTFETELIIMSNYPSKFRYKQKFIPWTVPIFMPFYVEFYSNNAI